MKTYIKILPIAILLSACMDTTNNGSGTKSETVTSAAALSPAITLDAEKMLIGGKTVFNHPACNLNYYPDFYPVVTTAEIEFAGDTDDIETTYPRHFSALSAASMKSVSAAKRLKEEIITQARGKSLIKLTPSYTDVSVNRMIQPVIVGYAHHKNMYAQEEQKEVEDWLNSIIDRIDRDPFQRGFPRYHNVKYRNEMNQIYLGVATENTSRFNRAIKAYKDAVDGMRADGSFVNDSSRGGSSINYTASSISHLVMIAEMAAVQGVDVYSYRDGHIHEGIKFLLDITKDPSLILPYSSVGNDRNEIWETKGKEYDYKNPYNGWNTYPRADFIFYYINRFPSSENAKRLKQGEYYKRIRSGNVNKKWDFAAMTGGPSACFAN
ncbi:MAG: alginate lyase family protein [Glaciecola sp.]